MPRFPVPVLPKLYISIFISRLLAMPALCSAVRLAALSRDIVVFPVPPIPVWGKGEGRLGYSLQ